MSEEALDGRGAASLLPRYDAPSEHVPAALRKRRAHVPHLGQGATSIVKSVLPWWRLSWQPSAHKIASEGLRLLSALGRRGLMRQNPRVSVALGSARAEADVFASLDHALQARST